MDIRIDIFPHMDIIYHNLRPYYIFEGKQPSVSLVC